MKVALHNLGCKVNAYETDSMKQQLSDSGYEIVPFDENADIYVINTCTVTNIADRKSRQILHKAKKLNPNAIVIATGCYAQSSKDELEKDECIDIIIGNNKKGKIVEALNEYFDNNEIDFYDDINKECEYENLSINKITGHIRAYIKIQDGCNHFCSYCIIPYTRGRVRSRSYDSIINEIKDLACNGVKEVILTGIQLSAYGFDFDKKNNALIKIINQISDIEGIQRIRLGSLEPNIITEIFVKQLSKNDKFCPHFHLSLQSGSDTVLKRMNRHYNSYDYLKACDLIRENFYLPAITTDIIVGFPGESDNEFDETINFIENVKLAQTHIFKYSKRKGTRASMMPNQVDESIKSKRSDILSKVCKELEKDYILSFIEKTEEVLVEDDYINIDGIEYSCGHTKRYVKIAILGKHDINKLYNVYIERYDNVNNILIARLI